MIKKNHVLTLFFTLIIIFSVNSQNLLLNSDFTNDLTDWNTHVDPSANAEFVNEDPLGQSYFNAKISSGGNAKSHITLFQDNITLIAGKCYEVSFYAWVEREISANIDVSVNSCYEPYENYSNVDFLITNVPTQYNFWFIMNNITSNFSQLKFNLGKNNDRNICLDNVIIVESSVTPTPSPIATPYETNLTDNQNISFDYSGTLFTDDYYPEYAIDGDSLTSWASNSININPIYYIINLSNINYEKITKMQIEFLPPYYPDNFQFGLSDISSTNKNDYTLSPELNGNTGVVDLDISGYNLNNKYVALFVNSVNPPEESIYVKEIKIFGDVLPYYPSPTNTPPINSIGNDLNIYSTDSYSALTMEGHKSTNLGPNITNTVLRLKNREGNNYWQQLTGHTGVEKENNYYKFTYSDETIGEVNAMTFLGNGNVGIGTINPIEKLHVEGNIYANGNLHSGIYKIGETGSHQGYRFAIYSQDNEILTIKNKNVGIGIAEPSEKLEVNGTIKTETLNTNEMDIDSWSILSTSSPLSGGPSLIIKHESEGTFLRLKQGKSQGVYIYQPLNVTELYAENLTYTDLNVTGNCGIGVTDPTERLEVDGTVKARRVFVTKDGWADYVFKPDYNLRSLNDVEKFIDSNGHLPDIPSEDEVRSNGIDLGEIDSKLLQKIEELTLYMIDMNKKYENVIDENRELKEKVEWLKKVVK